MDIFRGRNSFGLADLNPADNIPLRSIPSERSIASRDGAPNRPATLYWGRSLDGGDAGPTPADERDRVYPLEALLF